MADAGRLCTECPNPVSGRALTCSTVCRQRRSVRLRKDRPPPGELLITDDASVAARELLRDELRPAVREYITSEVLDGLRDLIGHLPVAIAKAVALLDSEDEEVRLKAATLLLRHGLGPNIVPDVNEGHQQELNVHFNLPRPTHAEANGDGPSGVIETKQCDSCGESKTLDEFVAASDRCQVCFDRMREAAAELLSQTHA